MKLKITLFILIAIGFCMAARAQNSGYAYTTANNLNFRESPSANGKKIEQLYKYQVVETKGSDEGWTKIAVDFWDGKKTGYVKSDYLQEMQSDPIEVNDLKDKEFTLMVDKGDDAAGFLYFEFKGSTFDGFYRLVSLEMQREGGSGTVDSRSFEGNLSNGKINIDDEEYPVIYDRKQKLLYLGGYLWTYE